MLLLNRIFRGKLFSVYFLIIFIFLAPLNQASAAFTWSAQTSGTANALRGVYFIDANTGWAVGDSGTILATANGGSTWSAQTSGTANQIYGVSFADANTGWAVGSGGIIRATVNGGSTWSAQTSGTTMLLSGVSFISATTGWAAGGSFGGGTIRVTTNGGTTWSAQTYTFSGGSHNFNGVYFTDANNGWAVGAASGPLGIIFATTNGGTTWTQQTSGTTNTIQKVHFVDANTGWAVGNSGTILTTANGGSTWSAQTSGTAVQLLGTSFVDASTGWAVGGSGTILSGALPASVASTQIDAPRRNPYPTLYSINPNSASANSGPVEITLLGDDFLGTELTSDSEVFFDGKKLAVKPMGYNRMTVTVPAELLITPGSFGVYVNNPGPGGGESGTIKFIVTEEIKSPEPVKEPEETKSEVIPEIESVGPAATTAESAEDIRRAVPPVEQKETIVEESLPSRLFEQFRSLVDELLNRNVDISPVLRLSAHKYAGLFRKNVSRGSNDGEVWLLQRFLNDRGFTVSESGPGSFGNETFFFGPATQAALIAFQKTNGIEPALGNFGPKTRMFIETMSAE